MNIYSEKKIIGGIWLVPSEVKYDLILKPRQNIAVKPHFFISLAISS
jgi:hypothetical protein